ncbi:phytase [Arthrobacter sp. IA7]|uniref:phytase n=1 Tax=Arthrobacter ipis TaxID=2716202 RepID=UPI001684185E|nr:phytase [Arthrobacter ipis]MBD1542923.1 phytase [Arthrobacter ipis]
MTLRSKFAAVLTAAGLLAGLLVGLTAPVASAAVVPVSATVETAPIHGSGDAADDPAIWIHPTDPSRSTIIGTDKGTDGHGLVVYDLSGRELFYYPDGRMNNVDVRYNFPLGSSRVGLVGVSNRVRSLDFYKVNESDRSLTKVGSFAPTANIATPRGFSFYHSPDTGKYFAYVTDIGKVEQWELDGSTGSVTGRLVRSWTVSGPAHTEGLVADDEMKRIYIAQEDIGGIWRYVAEPGDSTVGTKVVSTTEVGGDIVQDIKGISIYYGSGGAGYLLAASQGGNRFHAYARDDNRPLGAFSIPAANGIDAVTGMEGIDVTNFGVGGPFPQGFFVTQDTANDNAQHQNFKLVPWQSIAAAYVPALLVDAAYDPRKIGAGPVTPAPPDTTITSQPANPTGSTSAQFSFTSTSASATFACSLDSAAFVSCASPTSYTGLSAGSHTFRVRASDQNGVDPTPASYTWTVDTTPPGADTTPPDTTITSGPPTTSTSTSASFAFTSNEANSTFECSLDGAPRTACSSPQTYTGLSIGSHTFGVWATDAAGNTDATASTQTWSVGPSDPGGGKIVRESVSQATNTAASTTLTVPKPANVAQGDLLVSCLSLNGGSVATTGVPAGWTRLAAVTAIANPKVYGYYKVATGSEPASYAWATTSTASGGGIARYSGASGLDTAATSASGAAASSGTVPAVTSTTANAMLVGCMSVNSSSVTLTPPAGMAQAVETGARRFEVADGIQASPGPSGAKTWRFSSAREWVGWLVALRPKTP